MNLNEFLICSPRELHVSIFDELSINDFSNLSLVDHILYETANQNIFWKKYFPNLTLPLDVANIKHYVSKLPHSSQVGELAKLIYGFCLENRGVSISINCLFPRNPDSTLTIHRTYQKIDSTDDLINLCSFKNSPKSISAKNLDLIFSKMLDDNSSNKDIQCIDQREWGLTKKIVWKSNSFNFVRAIVNIIEGLEHNLLLGDFRSRILFLPEDHLEEVERGNSFIAPKRKRTLSGKILE